MYFTTNKKTILLFLDFPVPQVSHPTETWDNAAWQTKLEQVDSRSALFLPSNEDRFIPHCVPGSGDKNRPRAVASEEMHEYFSRLRGCSLCLNKAMRELVSLP